MDAANSDAPPPIQCETSYRDVIDGSPQGIIVQQDGKIVYANWAMSKMFGYADPREMIGLSPFEDLIDADNLDEFRTRTASVYRGASVSLHPGWKGRRRDRKEIWLTSTAHKTKWRGCNAVASFYLDITDRQNAEFALRENEARYRAALVAGKMGAWETDFVTKTRIWTPEGMALFGLSLPGGVGRVGGDDDEYLAAIHPEDRHLVRDIYKKAEMTDSFLAEYRIVRPDGQQLWLVGRGQVIARNSEGRADRLISIMGDVSEIKATEKRVEMLMHELAHRSGNLIAVVQSIGRAISRETSSLDEFHLEFGARLQALGASQQAIAKQHFESASLGELIRKQLRPFVSEGNTVLTMEGPPLDLAPEAAHTFGLAIHELATNSVKHGAWSTRDGKVSVSWTCESLNDAAARIVFVWEEHGARPKAASQRKGFGHTLLYELLPKALRGTAESDFIEGNFRWKMSFPKADANPRQPV